MANKTRKQRRQKSCKKTCKAKIEAGKKSLLSTGYAKGLSKADLKRYWNKQQKLCEEGCGR